MKKEDEIGSHLTMLEKWLTTDQYAFEKFYPEVKYQIEKYPNPNLKSRFDQVTTEGKRLNYDLTRERRGDYACLRCSLKIMG